MDFRYLKVGDSSALLCRSTSDSNKEFGVPHAKHSDGKSSAIKVHYKLT